MHHIISLYLPERSLVPPAANMAREVNQLAETATRVTRTIELLDHSLSRLILTVSTCNMATQVGSHGLSSNERSEGNYTSYGEDQPHQNVVIEAVTSIGELGNAAKDVVEALNVLPKGLSKIPGALGIPANIASGAEGFAEMSTKENTTTAEKISIGAKILTGAAGMIMAGLEFELPGLIIYTVAEAITTYASIAETNKQKQQLFEAAQKKRYEHAMRTFVMDEDSADAYTSNIVNVQPVTRQALHRWKMKTNPADEVGQKYGRHAYDLTIPVPVQTTDQLDPRLYLPKDVKYNRKADETPVKRSYFEKTFHLQQQLIAAGTTGGNAGFVQEVAKAREDAQRYGRMHHTHILERTDLAIRESAYDLLNRANGQRQIEDDPPIAKKSSRMAGAGTGRTVVINLNRPLIEHFTITASDTKTGISNLKEQVEQALLEVLNNANSIN